MLLDCIVISLLLVSVVVGFLRGVIREILTVLGIGGGVVCAFFVAPLLSPLITQWLGVEPDMEEVPRLFDVLPYPVLADILSYLGVFVGVLIVLSVASHFLSNAARAVGMGPVDRTLGVVFGILRGVFLIVLLYLPVHLLVDAKTKESWFGEMRTHTYIVWMSDWFMGFLPSSEDRLEGAEDGFLSGMRQKLQDLELLVPAPISGSESDTKMNGLEAVQNGSNVDSTHENPHKKEDATRKTGQETGYRPEQRQKLDTLFEKTIHP